MEPTFETGIIEGGEDEATAHAIDLTLTEVRAHLEAAFAAGNAAVRIEIRGVKHEDGLLLGVNVDEFGLADEPENRIHGPVI
jgi:hypothetical protein